MKKLYNLFSKPSETDEIESVPTPAVALIDDSRIIMILSTAPEAYSLLQPYHNMDVEKAEEMLTTLAGEDGYTTTEIDFDCLAAFVDTVKKSKLSGGGVTISVKKEAPFQISVKSETGEIKCIIAPRIEDEEEDDYEWNDDDLDDPFVEVDDIES